MMTMQRVTSYFSITMLYGLTRGVYERCDCKETYMNFRTNKRETKPMLLSQKAGAILKSTTVAPLVWPFMLCEDAVHLELCLCKIDPATYGIQPSDD